MSLLTTPAAVDVARRAVDASSPISVPRDADTAIDALLAYHAGPGRARLTRRISETLWTAGVDAVVTALLGPAAADWTAEDRGGCTTELLADAPPVYPPPAPADIEPPTRPPTRPGDIPAPRSDREQVDEAIALAQAALDDARRPDDTVAILAAAILLTKATS